MSFDPNHFTLLCFIYGEILNTSILVFSTQQRISQLKVEENCPSANELFVHSRKMVSRCF